LEIIFPPWHGGQGDQMSVRKILKKIVGQHIFLS
jgi:hypothetical protein